MRFTKGAMTVTETSKVPYFVDSSEAPVLVQMPGLETTILTGLHDEQMMRSSMPRCRGTRYPHTPIPMSRLAWSTVGRPGSP